jgi:transposase
MSILKYNISGFNEENVIVTRFSFIGDGCPIDSVTLDVGDRYTAYSHISNFPNNVKVGDRFKMVTYFQRLDEEKPTQISQETFE